MPGFYQGFTAQHALSRRLFFNHPLILFLKNLIRPRLFDEFGHGLEHATKVSIDTSTIIFLEAEKYVTVEGRLERLMVLGEMAGLLHDIERGKNDHAQKGAITAARILRPLPLKKREIEWITCAIANHEAFTIPAPCPGPWGQLISDALYDADKFRWGPDNFTSTIWHIVSFTNIPLEELIERFPWGVNGVLKIKETFRTGIGRQFGPDIIDVGVEIGKEIYRFLLTYSKNGTKECETIQSQTSPEY